MASKRPYDEKKIWASTQYVRDQWLHERSKIAMPALSHWHASHIDDLVREARIKKHQEDFYWGSLVLTDSYLAWGGANLNAYTMIGIDLRWLDMVNLVERPQAVPVRRPPPNDYLQLVVSVSKRSSPNSVVGWPGAQTPDFSGPVRNGASVMWGWAVPRSPGEQLIIQLERRLTGGEFGEWLGESNKWQRALARTEVIEEEEKAEQFKRRFAGYDDVPLPDEGVLFCGQCGSRNPDISNFCAKCGARLVKL